MAESIQTLPHDFEFIEDNRSSMIFSGSIRLDPQRNVVELKKDVNGRYPITGDHYVIGPMLNPKAVRQWVGFQAFIEHHRSDPSTFKTGDGFRLHDGTNQWWWNGAAWTQSTTDWNTELEIAANIATFAATTRKLRVVVRLTTSDFAVTPTLTLVRIAWKGRVFAFEDMLYRTLVPLLKGTRVIIDFAFKVPMPGGSQLDIGTRVQESGLGFDVVDVEAVFNNNTDPDHYNNLMSTYVANTGLATLATPIPVGQFAFCRLVLRPQVAVMNTSQDFTELPKVPALLITDIDAVDSQPLARETGIANKADQTLIRIPPPYRFNFRFTMIALAPGGVDMQRTLGALVEMVDNNPLITSAATGEQHRFQMIDEFNSNTKPTNNALHSMQATFQVHDVLSFSKSAVIEAPVTTIHMNLDEDSWSPGFSAGFGG